MTPISEHFTVEELTFSDVALRQGFDNTASPAVLAQLTRWATLIGEPVRALLGVPLRVNSGYRCQALNAYIGGATDSDHMYGCAADLLPLGLNLSIAFAKIQASAIPYQQLIFECNSWLHVSCVRDPSVAPRRQCLLASGGPGNWSYRDA